MIVSRTMSGFDADDIDELAGDCLFGPDFLSFVEAEHQDRADIYYFSSRENGRLTAFAPAYVYREAIPVTFRLPDFLGGDGGVPALGDATRHLVVGVPIRLRSRIPATGDAAARALLDEIVDWARSAGLTAVVFSFVLGSDEALRDQLSGAGFASAFYEGDFYLPIAGDTMEEFLSTLPRGPRKRFVNDINHFRDSGLVIEDVGDLAANAPALADLHRLLMERYRRPGVEFTKESFRRYDELVHDRDVLVVRDQDRIVGFSLSLLGHGVMHVLRYGRDDDADGDARIYATLGYAEPLRRAVESGQSRVHFGKSAQRFKTLRGCSHEDGIVYVRALDPEHQARLAIRMKELDGVNRARFEQACRQ